MGTIKQNKLFFILLIFLFFNIAGLGLAFPRRGLDSSWVTAMAWAQTHGLSFGKDIIFTFGPYSTLFTGLYNPSSDLLFIFCRVFIYSCISIMFWIFYTEKSKVYTLFILAVCSLLPLFGFVRYMYFSYMFLYAICFICFKNTKSNFTYFSCFFITAGLALIMLAKGSHTSAGFFVFLLSVVYCLFIKRYKIALCALITLPCAVAIFWLLAGQPLSGISIWFESLIPISSGYTEAMALAGPKIDILVYLSFLCVVLASIFYSPLQKLDKLFLSGVLLFIAFMTFKAGFVRHDAHKYAPLFFLLFGMLFSALVLPKKWKIFLAVLCLVYTIILSVGYRRVLSSPLPNYYSSIVGIADRLSGRARIAYDSHIQKLKELANLPVFAGTSDIYSGNQTDLIISGNTYNPRPILQSYSAYTPHLSRINAAHISGDNLSAPDNIFFTLQTIDDRYPTMDDGMSWLAFLDYYHVSRFSGNILLLQKNTSPLPAGKLTLLMTKKLRFNEEVTLPDEETPLFVKFIFKKGLACKLLGTLYKYPQLDISFCLASGMQKTRRLISGMTETGFFLSPYITTTKDFMLLATNNLNLLKDARITTFTISQRKNFIGVGDWDDEYSMELYKYTRTQPPVDPQSLPPVSPYIPSKTIKSVPCVGNLDDFSVSGGSITADGWLVMQDPLHLAEQTYILAETPKGTMPLKTTAHARPDVASIFQAPQLEQSGFVCVSQVPADSERYAVGYRVGEQVFQCSNLEKTLDEAR